MGGGKGIEEIIGRKNLFWGKENYLRWFPLGISVSGMRWVISQSKFSSEFTLCLKSVRNSKGWHTSVPIRCACASGNFLTLQAQVCGKELSDLTGLLFVWFLILLKCSWAAMLCLVSLYICVLLFIVFSITIYHWILKIVPCAVQKDLAVWPSLWFILLTSPGTLGMLTCFHKCPAALSFLFAQLKFMLEHPQMIRVYFRSCKV